MSTATETEGAVETTKRPWHRRGRDIFGYSDTDSLVIVAAVGYSPANRSLAEQRANAQLIITAVNHHDELVEALQFALTTPGMIKGRVEAEAILAKIKEEQIHGT